MAPEASPGEDSETDLQERQPFDHDRLNQLADKFHRKTLEPGEARELKDIIESSDEAMAVYRRRMRVYREQDRVDLPFAAPAESEVDLAAMKTEMITELEAIESQDTVVWEELPEDLQVESAKPIDEQNSETGLELAERTVVASRQLPRKRIRRKKDRAVLHVTILFLVLLLLSVPLSIWTYLQLTESNRSVTAYYQLLDSKNEVWSVDAFQDFKSGELQIGKLYHLLEGIVEIKHVDGAMLRFNGRGQFILRENGVYLNRGSMVVKVTKVGRGKRFVVETRFGTVEGAGEIGLHVSPNYRSRLLVREGKIETSTPGFIKQGEVSSITMYESLDSLMMMKWVVEAGTHEIAMDKSLLMKKKFDRVWRELFESSVTVE